MFIPYELTRTDIGYQFITDSGLIYQLCLSEYYLLGESGEEIIVNSLSFFNNTGDTRVKDHRIKATVISYVLDYFNKNEGSGVVYICSPVDNLARHRRIIFGQWHRETDNTIEKHECGKEFSDEGYYSSLLIKRDNQNKQEIIAAFHRHLDAMTVERYSSVDE